MKNLKEVLELINVAIQENGKRTWFVNYSGHVNLLEVRLYPNGWESSIDCDVEPLLVTKQCYTDKPESVQEFYYWLKFKIANEL
jgi:hypothetical protein